MNLRRVCVELVGLVGLCAGLACRLPDTAGLACTQDSQCIGVGPQYCNLDQEICVQGENPTAGDADTGDSESESASESESESETSEMKEDMSIPDLGPQCGAAVGSCDKLDVLIVIDNSGSITEDEFLKLIAETDFAEEILPVLTDDPCDAQVGITTTDGGPDFQPEECRLLGALNIGSALSEDCWGDHPPYFQTGDTTDGLLCAIVPGSNYDSNERQMGAMLGALESPLIDEDGCNAGFLRDDAKLLVVLITDEDDDDDSDNPNENPERTGSEGTFGDWYERLLELKEDPGDIGFLTVMATEGAACGEFMPNPGNSDAVEGTAEVAQNIILFLGSHQATAGLGNVRNVNICQSVAGLQEEIGEAREFVDGFCNG